MSINATKKSTHKLIVDALQEDGVLCNSGTKAYNEADTYKTGGKGLRHSFHHINSTINLYHNFLKVLTGDERANIYESIPVIDFLDTDNTSLLNHYTFNEDGSLNTTSIQSISVNTSAEILAGTAKNSLEYILKNDPYTINRAVMGDVVAEQFFNTTEAISNDLNIVTVSSPDKETGLCYKGILSREMISTDGLPFQYTKSSPAFTYKVTTSLQLEVDWDDSTSLLSGAFVDENKKSLSYNEYFKNNKVLLDVNAKEGLEVILPNQSAGFVKSISQDRYKVSLTKNDICVILPKVAYSLDPTKIIVFKEDSLIYIFYVRDYTSSRELEIINPEDNLPSYITENHLNILSCYANIEKEYYADASGLMNGRFCEPKYTENNTTGRKVTKWRFFNDTEAAAAKSRVIPIGSRYYENHLLYRGSFKDEPLACRDLEAVDSNGAPLYTGVASYLYAKLSEQTKNMFGNYFFFKESEWKNSYLSRNATTLDFVITEEVLANPDKFALKDKMKRLDGTAITYDDVINLIDNALNVIEGTTLTIDTADSFVCRELREAKDAKAWDWWDGLFADNTSLLENTTDNFDNVFETFLRVRYNRHKDCYKVKEKGKKKEKRWKVDEYFGGFILDGLYSPLDIMNHQVAQSTENDSILLWPGSHSTIPTEILLLSRNNLELEKDSLIIFYNNSSGKENLIGFQVTDIKPFEPSKVDTIVIKDHTTDPEAENKNPVKTITVDPFIKGHDCYIYYLKNFSLTTEDITYVDHTGATVKLVDTLASIPFTPLAYPYDYFKGESSIDSLSKQPIYLIDKNHYNDVYEGLQGAYLLRGIPEKESNYDAITIGDSNVSLSVIGKYITDIYNIQETAKQKALYHILYNWPLTDSEENPITLGNFSKVVHSLDESADIIIAVANLKAFDQENTSYIKYSLGNLQHRLYNKDNIKATYLDFTNVDVANISKVALGNTLQATIKKALSEIVFKCKSIVPGDVSRPSLLEVARDIDTVFNSSQQTLTESAASIIDKHFGNNTLSLLTLSNSSEAKPYIDVEGLETQLENNLTSIIKLSDEAFKKDLYNKNAEKFASLESLYDSTYKAALTSLSTDTFEYELPFEKKQDDVVNFWHLTQPSLLKKLLGTDVSATPDNALSFIGYVDIITRRELEVETHGGINYYKGFIAFNNFDALELAEITWDNLYVDNIPETALRYAYDAVKSDMSAIHRWFYSSPKNFLEYITSNKIAEESPSIVAKAKAAVLDYIRFEIVEDQDTIKARVQKALTPLKDTWMREVNNKLENPLVTIFPLPPTVITLADFEAVLDNESSNKDGFNIITDNNLLLIQCMSFYINATEIIYEESDSSLPYNTLLTFFEESYTRDIAHEILRGCREDSYSYPFIDAVPGDKKAYIATTLPTIAYLKNEDVEDYTKLSLTWPSNKTSTAKNVVKLNVEDVKISERLSSIATISPDVVSSSLHKLADYLVNSLEGITEGPQGVKYLSTDKQAVGRKDSLYYRRYVNLNSRMNKLQGPLSKIPLFSKGTEMSDITQMQNDQLAESYSDILSVIPILKMTPIQYMKTQPSSSANIAINGKFYYKEALEVMKDIIGNNCILTCGTCTVKDSCPFYNEEDIINLYCNPATTLDLYVKDNELDLLVYDETSPKLECTEADGSTKILCLDDANLEVSTSEPNRVTTIHNFHKPYAEIQKIAVDGNNTNITATTHQINNVVDNLQRRSNELEFDKRLDTTGWLLGGRYGTVEYNPGKGLTSSAYPEIVPPSYKFLYNAMFIPDEETEVAYKASTNAYNVTLDLYENGVKKTYEGTTKIKIPTTLKGLQDLPADAQIYLASDDFKDAEGNDIVPLIYLNTLGKLRYVFDLMDTGTNASIQSADDKTLYAKDVAQWSINIAKGACYDEPVTSNINRDQYWMKSIKKKVWDVDKQREKWITIPGRPRYKEGYQDLVNDPQIMDPSRLVAGKPVVATYENFMRRISFGMYSSSGVDQGSWLIEWVSPREQEALRDNPAALEKKKEIQRATLPLMKTNLRLVIVK